MHDHSLILPALEDSSLDPAAESSASSVALHPSSSSVVERLDLLFSLISDGALATSRNLRRQRRSEVNAVSPTQIAPQVPEDCLEEDGAFCIATVNGSPHIAHSKASVAQPAANASQ